MQNVQLKVIFRGWVRNPVYLVIALLSLVIGLTCSILLVGFILNEYKIAHNIDNNGQHFLVQQNTNRHQEDGLRRNSSDHGLTVKMKNYFPEVEDICVCHQEQGRIIKEQKETYIEFFSVTRQFPEFFHPVILAGNLQQTLADPGEIAITTSFARQHFGRPDPIGENIHLSFSKINPQGKGMVHIDRLFKITTIIDDSRKDFLNFNMLLGLPEEDLMNQTGSINLYYNFLKLDKSVTKTEFVDKVNRDTVAFRTWYKAPQIELQPLEQIYFADKENENNTFFVTRDRSLLYIGGSVALVVLLIACFNYINISMTRTLQRLRNVGQQMVFGATKREMQLLVILETAMQVVLAFGIALAIIYSILPSFNLFMSSQLTLHDLLQGWSLWCIIVLLVLVTVMPSLYIFFKLGQTSLCSMLKQEYRQHAGLITGMVIAQFFVSLVLLITVLNINNQMRFIGHVRPDADRIYVLSPLEETDQWEHFPTRLKEVPGIEAITCSTPLMAGSCWSNGKSLTFVYADSDFYRFYDMDFVMGGYVGQETGEYKNIVVNETMIRVFDIKEPVGYELDFNGKYRITGVVRDFPIDDFSKTIEPLAIERMDHNYTICLKLFEGTEKATLDKVKQLWQEVEPMRVELECINLVELYENLHQNQQRLLRIIWVFTWVSLFLNALGLFGLAWFSVENRRKEIGMRKINGASVQQIIILLCARFLKWIVFAFVLAAPLAYWLVQQWMAQFVYKVGIQSWTFLAAFAFILMVGIATVIWQSSKAALVNPVEIIKKEEC